MCAFIQFRWKLCNLVYIFFFFFSSWFYALALLLLLSASFLCAIIWRCQFQITIECDIQTFVLNCRGIVLIFIVWYLMLISLNEWHCYCCYYCCRYAETLQTSAIMTNFGFIRFISLIVSHLYSKMKRTETRIIFGAPHFLLLLLLRRITYWLHSCFINALVIVLIAFWNANFQFPRRKLQIKIHSFLVYIWLFFCCCFILLFVWCFVSVCGAFYLFVCYRYSGFSPRICNHIELKLKTLTVAWFWHRQHTIFSSLSYRQSMQVNVFNFKRS